MLTFTQIKTNREINNYIQKGNDVLGAMGYTDHGFAHAGITSQKAADILLALGHSERVVELAKIAGYMHDIGNCINREDHAQSGAVMAFRILNGLGMDCDEVAEIICAIGHHDEGTGAPVSAISAAIILADKSDVRRSRVRRENHIDTDIHDRVNYAVHTSSLVIDKERGKIKLKLQIDTSISAVMDYFEIFLSRMLLCRRAAEHLGLHFELEINDTQLL